MKAYLIILYIIGCTVIHALADASFDDGLKLWGHSLEAISIAMFISGAFIFDLKRKHWGWLLVAFACWNIVGFDYLYNLFRGLPWDFHGTTSNWDIFLSKYPEHGIIFARVIFLIAGIFIPLRELK